MAEMTWHKSSYSGAGQTECVEVAVDSDGSRWVRHSQNPDGPSIRFTASEWDAFVLGVKSGEFD